MNWMFMSPPKFIWWNSDPQCDAIRIGLLKEIRSWEWSSHEWNQCPCKRDPSEHLTLLCHVRLQKERHLWARRWVFIGHWIFQCVDLGVPSSNPTRSKVLWFTSHSVYGIRLRKHELRHLVLLRDMEDDLCSAKNNLATHTNSLTLFWSNYNLTFCPGRCGSVGWASSCKPKGRGFDSLSGHMPGLRVWSLVGAHARGNQSMFLSHIDSSFPLFLPPFSSL